MPEKQLKYPFNLCVQSIKHFDLEKKEKFKTDFDETYNLFGYKLQMLMEEYGVASIDVTLSECLLFDRPTY